jgi:hypothetical protein
VNALVDTVSPCPTPQARNAATSHTRQRPAGKAIFRPRNAGKFFFQQRTRDFIARCVVAVSPVNQHRQGGVDARLRDRFLLGKTATEDVC